jgi:hypothetical protein
MNKKAAKQCIKSKNEINIEKDNIKQIEQRKQ